MGRLKTMDSQCSVQPCVFLLQNIQLHWNNFLWSLGCSHGNISKVRVAFLPELCSFNKTKRKSEVCPKSIWTLSHARLGWKLMRASILWDFWCFMLQLVLQTSHVLPQLFMWYFNIPATLGQEREDQQHKPQKGMERNTGIFSTGSLFIV